MLPTFSSVSSPTPVRFSTRRAEPHFSKRMMVWTLVHGVYCNCVWNRKLGSLDIKDYNSRKKHGFVCFGGWC